MPAQIGIANNGGVTIRRGAPLRAERSGDSVTSQLKRTASIVSARCNVLPAAGQLRIGRDLRGLASGLFSAAC